MTERKIKELYKCTDGGFGTFLEIDYHTKKIRLLEMDQINQRPKCFIPDSKVALRMLRFRITAAESVFT